MDRPVLTSGTSVAKWSPGVGLTNLAPGTFVYLSVLGIVCVCVSELRSLLSLAISISAQHEGLRPRPRPRNDSGPLLCPSV